MMVAHDDADLRLGQIRIRFNGGSGGHRGVESIAAEMGSRAFPRIRMGIGREFATAEFSDYLLSPFHSSELADVEKLLERSADAVEAAVRFGLLDAMRRFN